MGYRILLNDEEDALWESESDATEVDEVKIVNARGEVTTIGSAPGDGWVRIIVRERAQVETYYDQIERKKLEERREMYEVKAEGVDTDAYVEADPETGAPVNADEETDEDTTEPATQEEQENEKVMAGDVEF